MANVSTSTLIPIGSYTVDQHHSYIGFEVKHLSLATVRGSFNRFSATIESAEDGLHARATIDAASVDTRVPSRDDDLRGAHFFDVEKFPEISFSSDVVTANENGGLIATGNLTIKGVTRPVELRGSVGESQEDPWGDRRVGFDIEGVIDRRDFNILGGRSITNSSAVVGTEIKLVITISAIGGGAPQ